MGDGLSEINENQDTTYANETLCQMWGRSRDEIVGKKVTQFLDENNKIHSKLLRHLKIKKYKNNI
jgi:PAS domain S-box-containing protein